MNIINLKKTLALVAVADTKLEETIDALKLSNDNFLFQEVLLLTSKKIETHKKFNGLNVINVSPINSFKEYNNFIIFKLHKYIKTSHILLIQWDGFIINKKKWENSFLEFDYIGSPFIPRALDYSYSRTKKGKFYSVGNGGFSLRSLKLLKSAEEYNLEDDVYITNNHEDGFFCVLHREF